MEQYLESSTYIDWQAPAVTTLAHSLAQGLSQDSAIAKACFEWVRDEIQHCCDYQIDRIACKASDVLACRAGFCFAKSHLLAALLRANGIPAGLCYQRLSLFDDGEPYSLHGLNAVYLETYGWYKLDPRGNKAGINAQFCPPTEQLAFKLALAGECDLPGIWHRPIEPVIDVLTKHNSYQAVLANLPDIESYPHAS